MQHPELPLFAFLSASFVLLPALWHWRSKNVAILAMIFWLCVANIINGVNAIVWAGNVDNPIPVWCDITTKIIVGASYALPLATLCICKHLEMVSSSRKVSYDAKDRQRRMIFEGTMCFGVPVVFMALHYIVQGHRFDIFENFGCQATIYVSLQAIFIIWFPQLLFSVVTLIYASLALHNFIRRRLVFAAHLQNSNSALTTNRYLRLIAMALMQMVWSTSLTSYNLWSNISGGLRPWISWADVHSNFSRVAVFYAWEFSPQFQSSMLLFWWTLPASSLIFFVFFGFGEEAMKEYRRFGKWFKVRILRRPQEEKKMSVGSSPSSRRVPKALHLLSLKTNNTSTGSNFTSPSPSKLSQSITLNHLSQSSATLTATSGGFFDNKKRKSLEAQDDAESQYTREPAPVYFVATTPFPQHLSLPIDTTRDLEYPQTASSAAPFPTSPSLPDLDTAETFSLSTFSYYDGASSSPTAPLPSASSLSVFPPEMPTIVVPQSLPPPPRHGPRHAGSNTSFKSTLSAVPSVPEDVGPASYQGRPTLGVNGGGIFVTVQREAQTDLTV